MCLWSENPILQLLQPPAHHIRPRQVSNSPNHFALCCRKAWQTRKIHDSNVRRFDATTIFDRIGFLHQCFCEVSRDCFLAHLCIFNGWSCSEKPWFFSFRARKLACLHPGSGGKTTILETIPSHFQPAVQLFQITPISIWNKPKMPIRKCLGQSSKTHCFSNSTCNYQKKGKKRAHTHRIQENPAQLGVFLPMFFGSLVPGRPRWDRWGNRWRIGKAAQRRPQSRWWCINEWHISIGNVDLIERERDWGKLSIIYIYIYWSIYLSIYKCT